MYESGRALGVQELNSATALIQRQPTRLPMQSMYYIGLDVHKKSISYRMKDASDQIYAEGAIPATRFDLDRWLKTLNSLNRPVTLLKSDAQYSQSFGEGQTTGKNPTQDGNRPARIRPRRP